MIIDVARHVGFGGALALTAVPLDEFRVTLPLDGSLAGRVRRCAVEVLTEWSLDASTIATAVIAADALGREVSWTGGDRSGAAPTQADRPGATVDLQLSATTHSVRIALTDRVAAVARPGVSTAEQTLAESLLGSDIRWGISHDAAGRTRWFDIAASSLGGDGDGDPRMTELYRARSRGTLVDNVTRALTPADGVSAIAAAATHSLRRDLQALFVGIVLREHDQLRYVGLHPAPADDIALWPTVPLERCSPVAAACRDEVLLLHPSVDSVERDFAGSGERMRAIGAGSMVHVPLFVGDTCIGTLGAGWVQERRSGQYRDELVDLGNRIGTALGRRLDEGTGPLPRSAVARELRADEQPAAVLVSGSVRINLLTRVVAVVNQRHPVRLTGREYDLLVHLVRHSGEVQTRRDLLRDVWGIDFAADTSVVEVTISRLRKRLGIPDLRTIKDVGYVFGDIVRPDLLD